MKETLEDILDTMPPIPASLKRIKEQPMTPIQEKKARQPRVKVDLPTSLTVGLDRDEYVLIEDLPLEQLVSHSRRISDILESVPRLELERRAIRKAIIAKA